jgi:hypothetical protein
MFMNRKQKVSHDIDLIVRPLLQAVGEALPAMVIALTSVAALLSVFFKATRALGDTKLVVAFTGFTALYGFAMASRERGLS